MALRLAARLVCLTPTKIADLQENNTTWHDLDLSNIVPEGTVAVLIDPLRQSGAGNFVIGWNGDETYGFNGDIGGAVIVGTKDRLLHWKNSVANDDWDIILFGYFVQKRTR